MESAEDVQGTRSAPGAAPRLRSGIGELIEHVAGVVGSWCPAISPDGTQIAYVTDRSGLPRMEVAHLGVDVERADHRPRQVSAPDQEVISVSWSPDGRWLAYLVSPGGSIRAELHAVRPDGSDHRALAGTDPQATVFAGCWTTLPGTYAFSRADGHGPDADIWLVDVESGALRTVASGGFLQVTSVSPDARRLVARRGPRGRRHLVLADLGAGYPSRPGSDRAARRLLAVDFPVEGTDLAEDGRFSSDGSIVYLRTAAGRDRFALGAVPLAPDGTPGHLTILAERTDGDLDSYAILDAGRAAMLVWNIDGYSVIEMRDLVSGKGYRVDIGSRVMPGWSIRGDGRSGILELTEPVAPRSLYHVELVDHPASRPPVARRIDGLPVPRLPAGHLCVPESLSYRSYDGLSLRGLLYRRVATNSPMPTVVLLHGGPESQERPAFSILIQSLGAAGFAVFAPNVRGSTGYGQDFMRMDDIDHRESSFLDVPATVRFLVESGISAPGHLGVHGWSYGGYLALVALTRWPELFACGSSHAGMSDLEFFFRDTEPWMAAASVTEYGDPATDLALLRRLSPLHRLDRARSPIFFLHGRQDTNVPVGESVRAHEALLAAGVPTDLMLLDGEGHTIVGREGRIRSTEAIVDWHLRWAS